MVSMQIDLHVSNDKLSNGVIQIYPPFLQNSPPFSLLEFVVFSRFLNDGLHMLLDMNGRL